MRSDRGGSGATFALAHDCCTNGSPARRGTSPTTCDRSLACDRGETVLLAFWNGDVTARLNSIAAAGRPVAAHRLGPGCAQVTQRAWDVLGRNRSSEVEALRNVAAELFQALEVVL